jgi:hypothetical protein
MVRDGDDVSSKSRASPASGSAMLNSVVRELGDTPYIFSTRVHGRSDSLEENGDVSANARAAPA